MSPKERTLLRDLAKRVRDIAALPVMTERKELWRRHNSLTPTRPMILIFPEGSWSELMPESALLCADPDARRIEAELRRRIHGFEHFASDNVVEAEWVIGKTIRSSGWGLESKHRPSTTERGAWRFEPVIIEEADLDKLRHPELEVDETETRSRLSVAHDLFGDILTIRSTGITHIGFHLMQQYTYLRGLEETMVDMYENPRMLHRAMAFLEEGNRRLVQQYIDLNLLSLNNNNTYHSSGGNGYTDDLPAAGFDPARVRPCDMWASAESQELAQVGPRQHVEFALDYEKRLLAPFGLNGYGCCENLTRKLADVLTIPNIRRISIAPTANVDSCAEQLGNRAIFSWKPDPARLVGRFDEAGIEEYIRHTVEAAKGCVLEMILKDTHTCEHHPERFDRWSEIARRAVEA